MIAIAALWILGRYRLRRLNPVVSAFYRAEVKRRRNIELTRGAFKAGPVVLTVVAVLLLATSNPDWTLPLLVGGTIVTGTWLATWRRLWRRTMAPKLDKRQMAALRAFFAVRTAV